MIHLPLANLPMKKPTKLHESTYCPFLISNFYCVIIRFNRSIRIGFPKKENLIRFYCSALIG